MTRTTVNVDQDLVAEAKRILGTTGLTETMNAALREIIRRERLAHFSIDDFDITDEDLADARRDRAA